MPCAGTPKARGCKDCQRDSSGSASRKPRARWSSSVSRSSLLACAAYVLRSMVIGRWLFAVGSDPEAARLSGLRPRSIVMGGFVALGALTALAAVLNDVRFSQVPPSAGIGLELKVLAAAVVGGTLITGGRGTVLGTMAGIALLGTLGTGLTFVGLSPFWEKAAQGAIILVAAAVDSARARPARPSVSRA